MHEDLLVDKMSHQQISLATPYTVNSIILIRFEEEKRNKALLGGDQSDQPADYTQCTLDVVHLIRITIVLLKALACALFNLVFYQLTS